MGSQVFYDLDEENNWGVTRTSLQKAADECKEKGYTPRCIILVNPCNPTGSIQTYAEIEELVKFAHENNICVIGRGVLEQYLQPRKTPFHFL